MKNLLSKILKPYKPENFEIPIQRNMWNLYILKCSDESFYTGITTNIERRVKEHNSSPKGSKYTRTRRPVKVIYVREYETKPEAAQEEYRIKKLTRQKKMELIKK